MELLSKYVEFKNGKKRPVAKGYIPVYGGNGILDYTDTANMQGGVVIGRVGVYCGNVFLVRDKCWVSDNAIKAMCHENIDLGYLYYLLSSLQLNERRIGTSQPLLTQNILNNIEVEVPELTIQKKIAGLLELFDSKIKLNKEINKNLEQQAQTIYRKMFMDNPEPDWGEGSLSDIADIIMGQSPSGSSYNEDGIGTVFFQGRAEFGFRFPTIRLYTTEPKRMANANDTLMSVRAPVGDLNVAHTDCCIGRGLAAIRSKYNQQSFVLYTMQALKTQLDMFNGEGTVFGSINRNSLNNIPIIIPMKNKIEEFQSIVAPMDAAIRNNYDEICRLQDARDCLLPRLMSGELDVSSLDL